MDSSHNFGQIRQHLSRAMFHLNHMASLIPFFVFDEDMSEPPPVGLERNLVRWSTVGPNTVPTSSSSTTMLTHGQLPPSMILNPEPHLRPLSVRRHLEVESSNSRGRKSALGVEHSNSTPATSSGGPLPIAAARPAKRPEVPNPSAPALPDINPLPEEEVRDPSAPTVALPVRSEDSGSEADPAHPAPVDRVIDELPAPPAAAPPNPPPRIGHTIRGWAPVDDTDLITLKKDARARHSWKAIRQRLHCDPDSCRARWYWLKSNRPELSTPAAEADD